MTRETMRSKCAQRNTKNNLLSLVLQVRERRQRSEAVSEGVLPCGIVFPGQLELCNT